MRRLACLLPLLLAAGAAMAQTVPTPALPPTAPEIRAQLVPKRGAVLSAGMAARVEQLPLRDGDRFDAGAVLAAFDCKVEQSRVARARAMRDKARKVFETSDRLSKMDSASGLELDVAAAELKQAEAELALEEAVVERCVIKAPFPGRVAALPVRRYQFVAEGQPVIEVLDDRELEVEMIVPSRWLSFVRQDHRFGIEINETGRSYQAKVTRVSGKVDPVSQSLRLYGAIEGDHPELMAGMSGRVAMSPP
ncbi:MAG TPA: efflux RND transporter periplasmic adaptor subunit [Azospirillaceae bacterium]|nr:efflux RND transporter periplasmic adaptor subunit [Azospirillaceae bacterium]